ncbi:MAG: MATE family efflux transporter [Anaerolineae bacterium]
MPVSQAIPQRPLRDLTTGSLGRHILNLALPSMAEMAIFGFVSLIHTFWLGKLGGLALAAEAVGMTLRMVLISPMMGLSTGGMAVVARYIGARDQARADRAVMQAILLVVAIVLPLALIGQLWVSTMLGWMGAEGELLAQATAYLRIIFGGLLFMEMLPTLNGVLRGAGHPEQTLRIQLVSLSVMLALDPILIFGLGPIPAMGVRGAAWASVLSSAAGVAAQIGVLARGSAGVRLHRPDLAPDLPLLRSIVRIALPTTAQRFSPNLANALLVRLVSSLGADALTAYSLVTRLFGILQTPAVGLGAAAATLVGQNLGAERPERASRAVGLSSIVAVAISLLVYGMLALWPSPVLGLFSREPVVLAISVGAIGWLVLSGVAMGWSNVVGSALGGAGDTLSPMWVSMGSLWLVQLPLCWALAHQAGLGPLGIWMGLAASYVAGGVAMQWMFRRGRWRRVRL